MPHSISGCIDSVTFNHCYIGKLNAYAIKSIETLYSIAFESTVFDVIESQTLKKLNIEHFTIRNCNIRSQLPSRAFSALTISSEMIISNCTFTTISSHAIELDGMKNT